MDVDAGAVLGQEVLALHLVKLGRLTKEVVLEILLVHVPPVDPQLQESSVLINEFISLLRTKVQGDPEGLGLALLVLGFPQLVANYPSHLLPKEEDGKFPI